MPAPKTNSCRGRKHIPTEAYLAATVSILLSLLLYLTGKNRRRS